VQILNGKLVFRTANIVHFHNLIFKARINLKLISDSFIENGSLSHALTVSLFCRDTFRCLFFRVKIHTYEAQGAGITVNIAATRFKLDCPVMVSPPRRGGGGRDFPHPSKPALGPTELPVL
jgi:hypothetical protein